MIQPRARTFSSNFLTSSSKTIMSKTSSELSKHSESWVKYARSMRRKLLSDAGLYSTIFWARMLYNTAPNARVENEAWRKLELSNWKARIDVISCSLSPSELKHHRSPQAWTAYDSSTTWNAQLPRTFDKRPCFSVSIRSALRHWKRNSSLWE